MPSTLAGHLAAAGRRFQESTSHPGVRPVLSSYLVSSIGEGISRIAIPWLALQVATPETRGMVVAATVLALTIPGLIGGLALNSIVARLDARTLIAVNATVRAGCLVTVAVLHATSGISLPLLLTLLALSSFADAWSDGGLLALVRELVPGDVKPVNSLVRTSFSLSVAIGPALAGVVIALWGTAAAIAIDGLSYLFLAAAAVTAPRRVDHAAPAADEAATAAPGAADEAAAASAQPDDAGARSGLRVLLADALLLRLLALTFGAMALVALVQVALPIYVEDHLGGHPQAFGLMWGGFGLGSLLGGLAAGALRRVPLYEMAVAAALGWGACLAAGVESRSALGGVLGFTVGGLVYGPYPVLVMTLLQDRLPGRLLAAASTAWHSGLLAATPLGLALGGLLASTLDSLTVLRVSAYGMIALAVISGSSAHTRWRRPRARVAGDPAAPPPDAKPRP